MGESFQLSTAHAVHDETGWPSFMRHIKDREGWYEYAGCHVNVLRGSESYVCPSDKFAIEDFPYRTTCYRKDDAWFILDQKFILWPKHEEWNEAVAICEVKSCSLSFRKTSSIFGKGFLTNQSLRTTMMTMMMMVTTHLVVTRLK